MKSAIVSDRRATGLLDRVRDDVSRLRDDIGHLLTHTKRETLPNSAREIADQAKQQFAAGSAYAVSRLRGFTRQPPRHSANWVGGVVVTGLIAYGVYALLRNNCCNQAATNSTRNDLETELPE